jgi:hypothetical protein
MNIDLEVKVRWRVGRTIRANRKAAIARDSLKAAGSETGGATYRNRIEGGAIQGERANDREALATGKTSRGSGARAGTVNESYLGRSRFTSERATTGLTVVGARRQQRPQ